MAFSINDLNYEKDSKERMPWEHYTEEFGKADPAEIARRLSIPYDDEKKELTLKFLGSVYHISWPDFQVTHEKDDMGFYPLEEMIYAKILTIRFLLNGNISQGSGKFKTYREMPWGEVYLRQFDGRCIKRLAFSYGNRIKDFQTIMETSKSSEFSMVRIAEKIAPLARIKLSISTSVISTSLAEPASSSNAIT